MNDIRLKITNTYEDDHETSREVAVREPDADESLEEWWDEVVLPETGDGHGIGNKLGYCYTAEVIGTNSRNKHLKGIKHEWSGR